MISPPDQPREIDRPIHEHEIFLSFVNDVDAEMFNDWWNGEGFKLFESWVNDNAENY